MDSWVFGAYLQRDENGVAANGGNRTLRLAAMYVDGKGEYHLNRPVRAPPQQRSPTARRPSTRWATTTTSASAPGSTHLLRPSTMAPKVYGDDFRSLAVGIRHNF